MRAPIAVALLFALAACGGDSTSPDLASLSGDYVLRTVNGGPLPITIITRTDFKLEISSETLFVKPSGVFADVTHYVRTNLNVVDTPADTLGGTWSASGTVMSFAGADGSQFTGTVGGAGLTIEGGGLSFRYIK
jgi:hypothetical protein